MKHSIVRPSRQATYFYYLAQPCEPEAIVEALISLATTRGAE
jgi:hypothetical protein